MYVLHECSICFQEYDSERSPHTIPCGHVFCGECLYTSLDYNEQCPLCRSPCLSVEVCKIVCEQQDTPSTAPRSEEPEDEQVAWKALLDAAQTECDYDQRRALLKHDIEPSLRETDTPPNLMAASNLLKMLLKAEKRNQMLQSKLEAARTTEQELRNQVQDLQVETTRRGRNNTRHSSRHKTTKAVALYDFMGTGDQELTFAAGTKMRMGHHSKVEDGYRWVYCKTEAGEKGFVPQHYLALA
ncbi:Zinc finger, C3HC4 type (RING finger) protein [Ceratobasidium sp. AG-Ba]|nr:Zinc finger, C3HC4 type (RING finger) protein [Ceratobasidium sp. AG-Ba]QRW12440.1 Zinc finger, C3HC4 type (RING finger) protein [Ceratobasidium sp. AG-Ba]